MRPTDVVETSERVVAPGRLPRRLDRAHVAAIVQQIPGEGYSLLLHRPDPVSGVMRPRRAVIGDIDGRDVLALIDRERVMLHLHDIDEVLARFDLVVPDAPIAEPPHRHLRHGLLLASPRLGFTLPPTDGEGAFRIVSGSASLRPPSGAAASATVALGPGAVLPRRPGVELTFDVGDETLTALIYEGVPRRAAAPWRADLRRMARAIRARFGGTRTEAPGPIEVRLTRARPLPRVVI